MKNLLNVKFQNYQWKRISHEDTKTQRFTKDFPSRTYSWCNFVPCCVSLSFAKAECLGGKKENLRALSKALVLSLIIVLISCAREPEAFVPKPPFEHLNPKFIEFVADPAKDSCYNLPNGTRIKISEGSLINEEGKQITEPVTLRFRQFDDAVSIYLAGMPMNYNGEGEGMILETAGMFEIRTSYDGTEVLVDPEKPLQVTIGSNFTDTRQGFFALDEKGNWQLLDIPESRINPEADSLRTTIKQMQNLFSVPLTPEYFVFSYGRMADISINDRDWKDTNESNMKEMVAKMKKYGVSSLGAEMRTGLINYKGNRYDISEMLWKRVSSDTIPGWISKAKDNGEYNEKTNAWEYNYYSEAKPLGNDVYEFTIVQKSPAIKFTFNALLITHIRYLFRYPLSEWEKRKAITEKEISETETRLRAIRITEYTVNVYGMGVYNCDRPAWLRKPVPVVTFSLDGKAVPGAEIANASAFNNNLSSTIAADKKDGKWLLPFFKGLNRIVLSTKNGELGVFTGEDFNSIQIDSLLKEDNREIHLNMRKIAIPGSEAEFRMILEK